MKIKVESDKYGYQMIVAEGGGELILSNEKTVLPFIDVTHGDGENERRGALISGFHFVEGRCMDTVLKFWSVSKFTRWLIRQIMKLEERFNPDPTPCYVGPGVMRQKRRTIK